MNSQQPQQKPDFSGKITDAIFKAISGGSGLYALYNLYLEDIPKAAIAALVAFGAGLMARFGQGLMTPLGKRMQQGGEASGEIIGQAIGNTVEKTLTQVTRFHQQYLDALKTHCHNLKIEGYKGRLPRLALEDVYVPLRINPGRHPGQHPGRHPGSQQNLSAQNKPLKIWHLLPTAERANNTFPERLLAVIANPGYGKTTLLRFLTLSFANQSYTTHRARALIPILLLFREIYQRIQTPQHPALPQLIVEQIRQLPRCSDLRTSEPWFKERLQQGDCLVMLDGLDEVPESQRETVSQWAHWQMQNYPSQFILTSRPHGYDSSLFAGVQRIDILDFNTDQKRQFIDQWYRFITWEFTWKPLWENSQRQSDPQKRLSYEQTEAQSNAEAQKAADDLSRQLFADANLTELARNPLLLTIIAATHEASERLPTRRVHLYKEIFRLLLEYRPNRRDTRLTMANAEDNQQLLQCLATQLTRADRTQFSPEEGAAWIEARLAELHPKKTLTPQQFLREMQQVSGLLAGGEGDLYEFSHKTFQEYLSAVELSATPWGRQRVMAQLANEAWKEVVYFSAMLSDPTPWIEAALAAPPSSYALDLAQQIVNDSKRVTDSLKQQVLAARQQQEPESAAVRLEQRFRTLTSLDEQTAIDPGCITWVEYQLFLTDQATGQFHSQAEPLAAPIGQENHPAIGISWQDARWFCAWLATQTNLQPAAGVYFYRLPTRAEVQQVSAAANNLIPFTDPPAPPGNVLKVVRVQLSDRYKTLLNYLANGHWKEADKETYQIMCQAIGKEGYEWEIEDIQNFPCEDLRILDRLWVQFSGGRFGFSVQRDIYASKAVGGKLDGQYNDEAFGRFCDRVKWREGGRWMFNNLTYDLIDVPGHLPSWAGVWGGGVGRSWVSLGCVGLLFFSRAETCEL